MLGGVALHVLAVVDGDDLGVEIVRGVRDPGQYLVEVGVAAEQRTVHQRQILALVDVVAVKVGVARGVGDLRGVHALDRGAQLRLDDILGARRVE